MDQRERLIEAIKKHYKKKPITHVLECDDSLNETQKRVNVKDLHDCPGMAVNKYSYDPKIISQNNYSKEK